MQGFVLRTCLADTRRVQIFCNEFIKQLHLYKNSISLILISLID